MGVGPRNRLTARPSARLTAIAAVALLATACQGAVPGADPAERRPAAGAPEARAEAAPPVAVVAPHVAVPAIETPVVIGTPEAPAGEAGRTEQGSAAATSVPSEPASAEPAPAEPEERSEIAPELPGTAGEAATAPTGEGCNLPAQPPLPPPGSPPDRWRSFREPLAPAALWNPPGVKRVGLQVGHWQLENVPRELGRLGGGASGGGKQEWEVNLEIARRAKALLEAAGVQVDLLPATVPVGYRAHAFVSIHADGDASGRVSGFKIARPGFSSVPEPDDRLVAALYDAYGPATGLRRDDDNITVRMRYYYAFNSRRYCHAVAPGVPQAIVETGFLTNAADRGLLLGNPEAAARGIANGVLRFLRETGSS